MDEELAGSELSMFPKYQSNRFVQLHSVTMQKSVHHVYLNEDIVNPAAYSDYFDILNTAAPEDDVVTHINCNGGDGDTMVQMLGAMRRSQARVVTCAEGMVASAATFLLLAGDEIMVDDYATMMIHSPTSFRMGKNHEIIAQGDFYKKFWPKIYKAEYKDFLLVKEIKSVLDGKDIWLDSGEIKERLQLRNTKRLKTMEREAKKAGVDLQALLNGG